MIEILQKENCCGCNACVQRCPQQCISMHEDIEGFLYPQVDQSKCINCNLCNKVCPVLNQGDPRQPLQVKAAKNPDKQIRIASSSGGIFTLLAEQILQIHGVVFGARFNDNWEIVHDFTETKDGLEAFRGSKYSQSKIGTAYQQVEFFLKGSRTVLFSGTPCQIAGLRHFLLKEYPNLLTVEVICHGVPSPALWRRYLKTIVNKTVTPLPDVIHPLKQTITSISFRDKESGWNKFSIVIKGLGLNKNGKQISNKILLSETEDKNSYMQGFIHDLYLRPSCYACPSKSLKSGSDLSIADFWGVGYYCTKMDDDLGVSAVLINTQKGLDFWTTLKVDSQETTYTSVLRGNTAICNSCKCPPLRASFFEQIESTPFDEVVRKHIHISYRDRLKILIKMILRNKRLFTLIKKIAQ